MSRSLLIFSYRDPAHCGRPLSLYETGMTHSQKKAAEMTRSHIKGGFGYRSLAEGKWPPYQGRILGSKEERTTRLHPSYSYVNERLGYCYMRRLEHGLVDY